jgi:hypothetical protein
MGATSVTGKGTGSAKKMSIPAVKPKKKDEKPETAISETSVLNTDPTIVYNYQQLLLGAECPSCGMKLTFQTVKQQTGVTSPSNWDWDDRLCYVDCCGIRYSMVPQTVRILSTPLAELNNKKRQSDEEFLAELRSIQ